MRHSRLAFPVWDLGSWDTVLTAMLLQPTAQAAGPCEHRLRLQTKSSARAFLPILGAWAKHPQSARISHSLEGNSSPLPLSSERKGSRRQLRPRKEVKYTWPGTEASFRQMTWDLLARSPGGGQPARKGEGMSMAVGSHQSPATGPSLVLLTHFGGSHPHLTWRLGKNYPLP